MALLKPNCPSVKRSQVDFIVILPLYCICIGEEEILYFQDHGDRQGYRKDKRPDRFITYN